MRQEKYCTLLQGVHVTDWHFREEMREINNEGLDVDDVAETLVLKPRDIYWKCSPSPEIVRSE